MMSLNWFFRCLISVSVVVSASNMTWADTAYLKNGRTLDAERVVVCRKSDKDPRAVTVPDGKVRLLYSNGGWQDVSEDEVDYVERNDKDMFRRE